MRSALAALGSLQRLIWSFALWNLFISTSTAMLSWTTMLEMALILKESGGFCRAHLAVVVAKCPSRFCEGVVRASGPFQKPVKMPCCGHYNVILDAKTHGPSKDWCYKSNLKFAMFALENTFWNVLKILIFEVSSIYVRIKVFPFDRASPLPCCLVEIPGSGQTTDPSDEAQV